MRLRIFVNGIEVGRILAERQKSKTWLAVKADLPSPQYLSDLISGRRTAGPMIRAKLVRVLRPHRWEKIFRIEEMTCPSL
mgnify:CR=1 FL=1